MNDNFALLIDADNISPKYIQPILDELSKYGNVTYKRIYGDWTSTSKNTWKEALLQNSISPIQQFNYTKGKNATDSAMIIDAMDMLYTGNLEGFCIVSSDSDFTKLASRLRESGKKVIGMGEEKTPSPFRKACDIFTTLELLVEETLTEKNNNTKVKSESKKSVNIPISTPSENDIEEAVIKIISENQNSGKETELGEVGSRLIKLYPDFDTRRYGYSLLSSFLKTFTKIKLEQNKNKITVTRYEDKTKKEKLEEYIISIVKEGGDEGIFLGTLGQNIKNQFKDFKVQDYGYSQLKKYIQSFSNVKIIKDYVIYKNNNIK
ncbi:MAG: NYN domain-containing protein [Filifactoraceae bacterium]